TVQSGGSGPPRQGVVHARAVKYRETLADVHHELPAVSQPTLAMLVPLSNSAVVAIRFPAGVQLSQRNTPALFGAGWIDAIPDRVIVAGERSQRLRWGMASAQDESLPVGRA